MRQTYWVLLMLAAVLVLGSCAGQAPVTEAAQTEAVATAVQAAETPLAQEKDECRACHTAKETLIETAEKVAAASEGESKGVG